MKVKVKVKEIAQVRAKPTSASTLFTTLRSDDAQDVYLATKLQHGWYFVDETRGWINSIDLEVVEILEDFNDNDDSSIDSIPEQNPNNSNYNGDDLISAINKAITTINASKITFIVTDENGTREINLQTMLKSMQLALDDMQDVISKVNSMPNIPVVPIMVNGITYMLKARNADGDNELVWEQLDYPEISNTPSDPVLVSEF